MNEPDTETVEEKFRRLVDEWKKGRPWWSSNLREHSAHPAYQGIIELGGAAVPLILDEMRRSPDWWFDALRRLTRADPVPESDRGSLSKMTQAWLAWGEERGLLPPTNSVPAPTRP